MNYSKQRELIIDVLRHTDEHPTAETVYRTLKGQYPRLSLATVYRNLNQLCETGVIRKLHVADSPDRFDGNVEPHYHLCCKSCKKVIDITVPKSAWRSLIPGEEKHSIEGCDVIFYGTCNLCIEEGNS
ncbi:MAG: transcriptional repressor [Candidatus Fimivivens sp.]|nr:transcriptional repressor [Candidatus Fimivivens sp.]